jgi:hypothetical protein
VISLANTKEVLRLVNRPGNRPSHEGAAALLDECIALCREAGFRKIVLRGDTDFSQTAHLDRWHEQGDVAFVFGYDCSGPLHFLADELPKSAWKPLKRPPKYRVNTKPRAKPPRIKQRIVEERGFKDIRLEDEWVAEFAYRPHACRHTYRMVAVRKNLSVSEPRQGRFFDDYRYFFYITNQTEPTAAQIVFSAMPPPVELFHATFQSHLGAIRRLGLQAMARNYVHLTEHLDYARKLAQRSPDGLILSVDALAAQQAGAQFLSTGTHVWLSDAVAPRFLSVFEAAATEGLAQIDRR